MKKLLLALVILVLLVTPALAGGPPNKKYKGTWRKIGSQIVRQEDIIFSKPAPEVETLTREVAGTATRYVYFADGNFYCAYNDGWNYYICGANDGSDFFCKYYTEGGIDCTLTVTEDTGIAN